MLLDDIKIYLLAALRNANAEVLPFDWRATTGEFLATIDRYQQAAGDRFDLNEAREAASELDEALATFYQAVEATTLSAREANAVILELARTLVPINYTRAPRFYHDPALTIPPLPDLAVATELDEYPGDLLGFAQTELMRGQNRVVSAMRHATRRIASALTQTTGT